MLVILQPLCSASLSAGDVRTLISNTYDLISTINTQISSMQSFADQISPCPDSTGADPCSSAQSTANSVLSNLGTKTANAKAQLDTANNDLQNGAAPSDVLNEVGNSLSTMNDGIKYAITEADTIPASCPDQYGNDICPQATGAATHALALISAKYQSVKAEYDQLA